MEDKSKIKAKVQTDIRHFAKTIRELSLKYRSDLIFDLKQILFGRRYIE